MGAMVTILSITVLGAVASISMLVFRVFNGMDFTVELLASVAMIFLALIVSKSLEKRVIQTLELKELIGGDRFYVRRLDLGRGEKFKKW
ncbi:MAG: hypothetical protein QXO16_00910 [Archaeoglobaceae archaeon]